MGQEQREATSESAGLAMMGSRLYVPQRGAFSSLDPVFGGNATAYAYPSDPVNSNDVSGRQSEPRSNQLIRHALEAAVCRSLGYRGCALASFISYFASRLVKGLRSNEANAVRHFIWQSALSFYFGLAKAAQLGYAHEYNLYRYSDERADSNRDLANNAIARYWARSHMWQMWSYSLNGTAYLMSRLYYIGRSLYAHGWFVRL